MEYIMIAKHKIKLLNDKILRTYGVPANPVLVEQVKKVLEVSEIEALQTIALFGPKDVLDQMSNVESKREAIKEEIAEETIVTPEKVIVTEKDNSKKIPFEEREDEPKIHLEENSVVVIEEDIDDSSSVEEDDLEELMS
jgi:hypothetical protein